MLLDTSGLLCLHHRSETFHRQAIEAYRTARFRLTHGYVLAEYVALATARRIARPAVLALIADLLDDPEVETVWVDRDLNARALDLLAHREDKEYSLCDAVSFVLMRERRLSTALSSDHHFEQEGYRRLLG